jgi:nitrite reductase/ring-hydroxylating ferredoxin subunit
LFGLSSFLENRFFSILYHMKIAHHIAATLAACPHASFFLGSASIAGNRSAICSEKACPILEGKRSGFE